MLIPIRCYCCGKIVGNKWQKYQKMLTDNISAEKALNILGLTRYCCRRMLLSHVELIDEILDQTTLTEPKMQIEELELELELKLDDE